MNKFNLSRTKAFFSEKINIVNYCIAGLLAFLSTAVFGYLYNLRDYSLAYGSVSVAVFAAFFAFIIYMNKKMSLLRDEGFKKRVIFSFVLGFILALTYVFGYELQYRGYSSPGVFGKAKIFLYSLCLDCVLGYVFYFIISKLEKLDLSAKENVHKPSLKAFFISWGLTFLSWIPAFLAYYPCIMSFDFHQQVGWAELGHQYFSEHHPYLSTLEIEMFYKWGKAMGNVQRGMSFMGLFHMLLMSSALSFISYTIYKLCKRKSVFVVSAVCFALYPFNPVLTLCTTKDVVFSVLFIWFVCLLVNLECFEHKKTETAGFYAGIVITGILMCMFRNNAVYAVGVAGFFLLIFARWKKKVWILICTAFIVIGSDLCVDGVASLLGATRRGPSPEMHSVIIQCFGRVETTNRDSLPEDVEHIIETYIPRYSWNDYNPGLSDAIKSAVTADSFETNWKGNMKNVIKDWLYVGTKYPNEYLDAFLDLTRGYWFLDDVSFGTILGDGLEGRMGILYTYNSSKHEGLVDEIKHETKAPGVELFYEKIVSRNDCLRWPVVSIFFRISFYVIGIVFLFIMFFYKKEWKKLGLSLFPTLYMATLFLGPIVQIRYAFPVMVTVPMFFVILTSMKKENE